MVRAAIAAGSRHLYSSNPAPALSRAAARLHPIGAVEMSTFAKGLEGIVAAETRMSFIDGEKGILEYVGIPIGELSTNSTFEETLFLLWNCRLPKRAELDSFTVDLRRRYGLPDGMQQRIESLPKTAQPMHVLRTMVSMLSLYDPSPNATDVPAAREKALSILAQAPSIVACFDRYRRGVPYVPPDRSLTFAENFLYQLNGEKPTPTMARAFDICMILHADHGLNNSTFTARVIISTLSDVYSALTGAIGSLRGPLHGGANEGVMVMLNEIKSIDDVERYVMDKIHRKDKIMGFGHRVYKAKDPRATDLQKLAKKLAEDTGNEQLYLKSNGIERVMERELGSKGIWPNVDFYSATTYHCIGLKLDLFTPMFALSRLGGWSGHVIEQLSDNRLFRPKAQYVGPHDVRYTPIDKR
jgi:citrate synthase